MEQKNIVTYPRGDKTQTVVYYGYTPSEFQQHCKETGCYPMNYCPPYILKRVKNNDKNK